MESGPRPRSGIPAERWTGLRAILPARKIPWRRRDRKGGRPRRDDHLCWEAILWRLRSGRPWRMLPGRFGSSRTIQRRIAQWQAQGLLGALWFRDLERLPAIERGDWRDALSAAPGKNCGLWYWEMLGQLWARTATGP